ncbi:putative pak-box p21-rho-binding protein [Neofusicoccum parvum]|uniref:Pak-box p21-rho-binding protein n=2 Tax=Neofusicoccum parvum TaxID=310453 RepID=A0ACB5RR06_9PEZI|nr:putative pak-box p21-rho-binding protein [Neofusicoccum parvum UCRNP2]GME22957.1 putative pak-box p21-rho-binding protein [Neofusicoccum parvum]GME46018.1 putative pak-box p21-rho-binding protein [Neofusicoccum parvum]
MDLFKRNNGPPRSRQGSLDAAFMDDRSSESWAPGSHAQSHPDLPSPPDRRLRDQSNVRRSSVFTLRSRSNTANSMSSKAPNFDDQDRSQRRSSRDISAMNPAHGSSGSISEPAAGKQKPSSMFASRGRKLRRQSSKLSSTAAAADDVEEVSNGRRSSVFGKDRKRSTYETVEQYNLRMRHISSPFDFQHLTHTNSQHLQQALESSQNELVAEFWAHRASQMPNKELRGIKVEALTSTNGSSEALSTAQPSSDSSSIDRSSIVSPKTRELPKHQSPSPKSDPQAVRHTRSMGSFSQPIPPTSPKSPKSQDPHVPMVPPRMSSRLASSRGEDTPIAQAISSSRRTSGIWNNSFHRPSVSNEFINDLPFIPHAITTPDDTAMPSVSPSWNATDLEHIAEEEEGYFGRKSYDQSILYSPSPEMSPTQKPDAESDLPLRSDHMGPHEQLKSFANHRPTRPRPLSQMSDTLGAPFCPPQSGKKTPGAMGALQRSATMRRRSTFFRSLEDTNTWEDDIDYCYDIGADADCDFEWDRMSNDAKASYTPNEPSFAIRTSTVVEEEEEEEEEDEQEDGCGTEEKLNSGFMPSTFRPSLVVPSKTSIPDLDYRSAVSTSTNSLLTPVDGYTSNNPKDRSTAAYQMGEDQGAYTPSLLVPQDFKEQVAKEEMYEDLLNDYESDRHYPLMHARSDNTLSIAESSRSGPSRYSMGSSYESSLRSASVSLASPARAARSSTGSVPDLVHSRRAARRTMEIMVNRLSKELTFEDDEDCDGSASTEQQTFFADDQDGSDDETEDSRKPESRPTTRGGAMAAEAMMRSPVSPYHERSASDGAAKLLAKAGVKAQHTRTASSESQAQRRGSKTYTLSLFPAPPKTPKNF